MEFKENKNEIYLSRTEIEHLIKKWVNKEAADLQIASVRAFDNRGLKYKCKIHNEPVRYAFILDELNVSVVILAKCCEESGEAFKQLLNAPLDTVSN